MKPIVVFLLHGLARGKGSMAKLGKRLHAEGFDCAWPAPPAPFAVIAGTRSRAWTNPSSWSIGRGFPPGLPDDGTVAVEETRLPGMAAFAEVGVTRLVVQFLRGGVFT